MKIFFFSDDIDFVLKDEEQTCQWLERLLQLEKAKYSTINLIFCSDPHLHEINKTYLGHDDFTDIITFQYSHDPIEGELYISIDRVKENALIYEQTFERELKRVMAHGFLHLIGYTDKDEIAKKEMRKKEDYYLALLEREAN